MMFNIFNHLENVNQIHNEIPLHNIRKAKIKQASYTKYW